MIIIWLFERLVAIYIFYKNNFFNGKEKFFKIIFRISLTFFHFYSSIIVLGLFLGFNKPVFLKFRVKNPAFAGFLAGIKK